MMFDILLGVFLFLSPIFFLPWQIGNINALQYYQFGVLGNSGYNYLQLQFFLYGTVVLFIVALLSKPQREFKCAWAVLLFSMFCASVYFHPIGIKMFGNILIGMLLFYLVTVYTKDYRKLYKFILLASLCNTVFAVLQAFNINFIYGETGRIDGLMCLSTHLGIYQVIALPVCYALNPLFSIIPIISILLSKSVAAILIMLVWLMYAIFQPVIIKKKRFGIASINIFMFLMSLFAAYVFFNHAAIMEKLSIRFAVWIPAIIEILKHPFGVGLKPFQFNVHPAGSFDNPCSMYLGIIRYLGILVLIPLGMLIREVFFSKDIALMLCCLIILLSGVEKSIMDFPRLATTIIVLFALLTVSKGAKIENQV